MTELQKIILAVTRRKRESVILLIMLFLISVTLSVMVGIKNAESTLEAQLKAETKIAVTIQFDVGNYSAADKEKNRMLTREQIIAFGESDYVKAYDYNYEWSIESETMKKYIPEEQKNDYEDPYFKLKGVEYAPVLDVEEGMFALVSGRTFTEQEIQERTPVVIITEEIAATNGISIGDTISFQNNIGEFSTEKTGEKYMMVDGKIKNYAQDVLDFQVIGVIKYQEGMETVEERVDNEMQLRQRYNVLYVPNGIVASVKDFWYQKNHEQYPEMFSDDVAWLSEYEPTYFLKSSAVLDQFRTQLEAELPEGYKLYTTEDADAIFYGPINTVQQTSVKLFYFLVVIIFLLVVGIVYRYLRERRYEYGIYLTLAERRSKLLLRTILEVGLIAMIVVTPGIITGLLIAEKISYPLFTYRLESEMAPLIEEEMAKSDDGNKLGMLTKEKIAKIYHVEMNMRYGFEVATYFLVIALFSTSIIVVYLVRKARKFLL